MSYEKSSDICCQYIRARCTRWEEDFKRFQSKSNVGYISSPRYEAHILGVEIGPAKNQTNNKLAKLIGFDSINVIHIHENRLGDWRITL